MIPNVESPMVLLVDDEEPILASSSTLLRSHGFQNVKTLQDSRGLLPALQKCSCGVVVLDLFMPHLSGQELLPLLCRDFPEIPVLVMTAADEVQLAVECMRAGAYDYLVKPVENARFVGVVRRALENFSMQEQIGRLKEKLFNQRLDHAEAFGEIVTASPKMLNIFRYIEAVASLRQPVLITGETGTGKELIARAIHRLSGLQGAFVPINVAGLDDHFFADTLFGHKKGAFTGADGHRAGLITQAAGGTLFLDEIGDLKEASQVKLLRLLQEREYHPLGSDLVKKSDARIVVATHQSLREQVQAGTFRKDLFYRLCAHHIQVPPLRQRQEDIPLLLNHFLAKAAADMNCPSPPFPPQLLTLLAGYSFPGNVRELEGMVFDALARQRAGMLSLASFRAATGQKEDPPVLSELPDRSEVGSLYQMFGRFPTLKEMDRFLIGAAMSLAQDNQGMAAALLGISRQALNQRLHRSGQS
jgi:DNA-binding NtrC family response regulator